MIASFNFNPEFWRGLLFGLLGGSLAIFSLGVVAALEFFRRKDVYDNDHWKLNAKMPFTNTMWMNMGYWIDNDGQRIQDFQQACRTLLHKVLAEARVLEPEHPERKLAVLDLGIGCGDQSLELARLVSQSSGWDEYRYVGLTLNPEQFRVAAARPFHELQGQGGVDKSIRVFQGDAARPETWGVAVKSAAASLTGERGPADDQARWVLALDSLYHFSPDRRRILGYAARELDASFVAFDVLLSDAASARQRIIVGLLGRAMGCPAGAFLTAAEYRRQLGEAGYDEARVRFRDVSDRVFSGLVGHIEAQEQALRPFGVSMGKFKLAGRVFDWFDRSKALRATIVVAPRKPKSP
ncbi:hypothetical protein LX36DRAFT_641501 [Colletotrichum falcatum]|nr:hypothetical protein LX36DRAFT_641501 [Colletotrichum falcatum]